MASLRTRPPTTSSSYTSQKLTTSLESVSSQLTQLNSKTGHLSIYKTLLEAEQVDGIIALPGIISTFQEVALRGPYPWTAGAVERVAEIEDLMKSAIKKLNSDAKNIVVGKGEEEDVGRDERRGSGEWVVVEDGDADMELTGRHRTEDDAALAKELDQIERIVLAEALEVLCDSLAALRPLVPVARPAPATLITVTVIDHLGVEFLFPSSYFVSDLLAVVKSRYTSGPGSVYIQNGQFEIVEDLNRSVSLAQDHKFVPGSRLIVVLVVNGLSVRAWKRDGKDGVYCPLPQCGSANTLKMKDGERICTNPDCNLWFSFSDASSIVQAGTKSTQQKTTIANLPYTISDELTKSNEEYFSRFKAIKIKPASKLVGSSVEKTTIFACKKCDTHLAFEQNIVSTNFRGVHGKAYLIDNLYNINRGPSVERQMTTGAHTICDVSCRQCGDCVGWAYEATEVKTELYKIGKFILELEMITPVDIEGEEYTKAKKAVKQTGNVRDGKDWNQHGLDLLSRVRTVKGELLGLEELEARLKALMDEEADLIKSID